MKDANFSFQYDTETSQYWQSMAVAIIFGLLLSTLLTLGVVPTLYVIYDRYKILDGVEMGGKGQAGSVISFTIGL